MKKSPRKTINPLHDYICERIDALVKPEIIKQDKAAFGREYKLFQKLLKEHKDRRIWSNINFRVNSLAYFLKNEGREEIKKIQNKIDFVLKEVKIVEVGEEKCGEDTKVNRPLSIKEFLEQYENKHKI